MNSVEPSPTFRSGAVARMAGMPVSTLRIWEQRYQAVGRSAAASGHRLYSAADVRRVVLLRQLTQQGHAIGTLAGLDTAQLHDLSAGAAPQRAALRRIVVVGRSLAGRLNRPAVMHRTSAPLRIVGVFDSLEAAALADATAHAPVDMLVWQAPSLHDDVWPALKAAQDAVGAAQVAVTYRHASAAARDALLSAGASVAREPADDAALASWMSSLARARVEGAEAGVATEGWPRDAPALNISPAPPRFDDATLTEIGSLSSRLACECPSHVVELLIQISSFERYSAGCASRTPADAQLHAYLAQVGGVARMLFESALQRLAAAEGLRLPAAP